MEQRPEIQIVVKLSGEGFPIPEEMDIRDLIEDWIDEQGLGEVVQAGSGMGVMELAVEVENPELVLEALKNYISQLGIQDRTTLKIFP